MTTEDTPLERVRAAVEDDEYIHIDKLDELLGDHEGRWEAEWVDEIPAPMVCVYCNAPWSPEMVELVELSGYCETCSDAERVTDVFCSACGRLVYRKEGRLP